jgi:hypothetical protein
MSVEALRNCCFKLLKVSSSYNPLGAIRSNPMEFTYQKYSPADQEAITKEIQEKIAIEGSSGFSVGEQENDATENFAYSQPPSPSNDFVEQRSTAQRLAKRLNKRPQKTKNPQRLISPGFKVQSKNALLDWRKNLKSRGPLSLARDNRGNRTIVQREKKTTANVSRPSKKEELKKSDSKYSPAEDIDDEIGQSPSSKLKIYVSPPPNFNPGFRMPINPIFSGMTPSGNVDNFPKCESLSQYAHEKSGLSGSKRMQNPKLSGTKAAKKEKKTLNKTIKKN